MSQSHNTGVLPWTRTEAVEGFVELAEACEPELEVPFDADVDDDGVLPAGRLASDVKDTETPVPFVQDEGTEEAFPATNFTAAHFHWKLVI
jgi:hypothetical protein